MSLANANLLKKKKKRAKKGTDLSVYKISVLKSMNSLNRSQLPHILKTPHIVLGTDIPKAHH